jgi:aminomethyltransferase
MAFTAPELAPGDIKVSLCLAGDGTIVAPVLLACTAATEFTLWTASECAEGLRAWLEALIGVEQAGVKPFDGVALSEESETIATICLAGPDSRRILEDYTSVLPKSNTIIDGRLDKLGCVLAQLDLSNDPAWLIWTHETQARTLWRSFLSFEEVVPVGASALWAYVGETWPGIVEFLDDPVLPHKPEELKLSKLLRSGGDFVGARALGLN